MRKYRYIIYNNNAIALISNWIQPNKHTINHLNAIRDYYNSKGWKWEIEYWKEEKLGSERNDK